MLIPKVTDFGLAKRLDAESTAWTPEGVIVGTPTYMAPEQADGRSRNIGPAVDIYALGTILYEMLCGRPPFRADNWTVALQQILHEEPTPPTQIDANLPRDLVTICLKCLEKDPGRRYPSADELARDLRRFLDGKPIKAVPPNAAERFARLTVRDGYRIVAEVGRGPRGTVYQARHQQLKQPVVLKVFRVATCTQEEWENYLHSEAGIWAALAHPQVVSIQRGGWLDGKPYLASEYLPQGSLAARLNGRPVPLRQALSLTRQLAEIIGYLHRQGMIHGNLKPSNVLMAPNDIPRLTDFRWPRFLYPIPSIARVHEPESVAYLPPEIIADPNMDLRFDADIYGLGILLYELLTGRLPFGGHDAHEVLEQIRKREPEPPSAFNPDVTPSIDRTCLRCLHKNRWHRYVRAYDLSMNLRRLMEDLS